MTPKDLTEFRVVLYLNRSRRRAFETWIQLFVLAAGFMIKLGWLERNNIFIDAREEYISHVCVYATRAAG